ncbi:hypothetical protein F0562_029609 [Nyssa sinensis]|uniref:Reverse transcriptase/retrotransposon-derived protein RNase H-like domain-containing protein n=1 Tax=Nyssa sinensis TaxID=561372 RepID=A0A5J5B1K0_9ASTE|nr:hypothetical protein F0562_029609 [Nyssa sinensis]
MSRLELGIADKLQQMGDTINQLSVALLPNKEGSSSNTNGRSRHNREESRENTEDGIRMFKPKSLKEAISLARMRDEQLNRQKKAIRSFNRSTTDSSPTKLKSASPMKQLTWDEMQRRWKEEAEDAFKALKQAMTSTPTLAMPNFNEQFVIGSDASGAGIGAVLTQQGKPIAFISRALGITKQAWSTYAKEMLAIVQAIRTWHSYLLG